MNYYGNTYNKVQLVNNIIYMNSNEQYFYGIYYLVNFSMY